MVALRRWPPELHVAAIGIVAIAGLTAYALFRGVDGVMFGTAMAGIGGIVGWVFKGLRRGSSPRGPSGGSGSAGR